MKTEPNEPICAQPLWANGQCRTRSDMPHIEGMEALIGLSKREYFAGLAMQGLIAANYSDTNGNCRVAVQHADALINALNNEK